MVLCPGDVLCGHLRLFFGLGGRGGKLFFAFRVGEVFKGLLHLHVGLGILALQLADLVNRDHRNARVNGSKDFDFPGADPIVELIKMGIQLLPEGHTAGDRHGLAFDRTQARDMLLLYLAAYTAGFHKTDLKA